MIDVFASPAHLSEAEQWHLDALVDEYEAHWGEHSREHIAQLANQVIGSPHRVYATKLALVRVDIAFRAERDLEVDMEQVSELLQADDPLRIELFCWYYECLNKYSQRFLKLNAFLAGLPQELVGRVAPKLSEPARYKLLKLIGQGGMGRVYLALDRELNRQVAFKCLPKSRESDCDFRRYFDREVQISSELEHPSILPVYGSGYSSEGNAGYAMRLLTCSHQDSPSDQARRTLETLIDILHAANRVVWRGYQGRELLQRFREVCDTVAYAHHRNITHNDIKPHNIFVLDDETFLGDWGVADWLDQPTLEVDLGEYSMRAGTHEYMSPQRLQDGSTSKLDDVYSLGACLYHVLNGSPPSSGTTSPWKAHVPNSLRSICLLAMNASAEQRCESAELLSTEVGRWMAGERVQSHTESSGDWLRRCVQNYTIAFIVAGIGLVILVMASLIFSGVFYWQRTFAQRESLRAREAELNERELRFVSDKLAKRELQMRELLLGAFQAGNPRGKYGPDLTIREVLGLTEEKMRSHPGLDWDLKLEMLKTLAELYAALNQTKKAHGCLDEAWKIVETNPEATDVDRAGILYSQGMLRLDAESVDLLEKALALLLPIVSEADPHLLQILGEISWRKDLLGDADADDLMFASVIPLLETGTTVPDVKERYYRLMDQVRKAWLTGNQDEASRIIRNAAAPALAVPWLDHAVPSCLRAIAHKREKVDDLVVAEALLVETVSLTLEQSGKRKSYYEELFALSHFLANHKRENEALPKLNEIVSDLSKQDLAADATLGYAFALLGRCASDRGESVSAIQYLERAHALLRAESGLFDVNTLYVARLLATEYLKVQKGSQAAELLRSIVDAKQADADELSEIDRNHFQLLLKEALSIN